MTYGKNFSHNPKPTSTTYTTVLGGATRSYVTDRSFSGAGSLFVTLPAGGEFRWSVAADDDADISPLSGSIRAAFRASGVSLAGLVAKTILTYTDASTEQTATTPVVSGVLDFQVTMLPAITKNAAKTLRNIAVSITNPTGSSITVYVGGEDVRVGQTPDSFIHGDGPNGRYAWTGAANNSPSTRSAVVPIIMRGRGGSFYPTVNVSVVNRQKQFIRDVTDHFLDGSVTYDLDADAHKGSCSISLDDPGLIEPFADQYFDINVEIEYASGNVEDFPVGMFMADPPQERWNNGNDSWTYPGRDMLALLDTTVMRDVPTVGTHDSAAPELVFAFAAPTGEAFTSVINRAITVFTNLSPAQFSLAVPGSVVEGKVWAGNATVLQCLTDILVSAKWRKPWVTPAGIITSAPAGDNPSTFAANVTFSTGEDSLVRWPFEVDTDASGIGNRVRVISVNQITNPNDLDNSLAVASYNAEVRKIKKKIDKKSKEKKKIAALGPAPGPIIYQDDIINYTNIAVVVSNQDPNSPLSVQRLGRWIDLPDIEKPILSSGYIGDGGMQARGDAAAFAIGKQALIDASLLTIKARLTTEIHKRGLNEVYNLDLYDINDDPFPSGQGKYFCRGWSFQLGPPWQMVHNISRIIPFEEASF